MTGYGSNAGEGWERAATGVSGRVRVAAAVGIMMVVGAVAVLVGVSEFDGAALPVQRSEEPTSAPRATEHPTAAGGAALIGAWRQVAEAPLAPRSEHAAVWTGTCRAGMEPPACGEMLVWGGRDAQGRPLADGAAYDPVGDVWRPIAPAPVVVLAPPRSPAVWAEGVTMPDSPDGADRGQLLTWGARVDGARGAVGLTYDPVADRWRSLPAAPIEPRDGHTLVWTGHELVVWGGVRLDASLGEPAFEGALADGAAYEPDTGAWRAIASAHIARYNAAAASVGREMVIWGGGDGRMPGPDRGLDGGAVYEPGVDSWRRLPGVPPGVTTLEVPVEAPWLTRLTQVEDTVVLNSAMMDARGHQVLASLDLEERDWVLLALPAGLGRNPTIAPGPGRSVFVWGGSFERPEGPPDPPSDADAVIHGAMVHVGTGDARVMAPGLEPLGGQSLVWTGRELIVYGGMAPDGRPTNQAAAFDPARDATTAEPLADR